MNVNRIVEVQSSGPVRAFQDFLAAWWEVYPFDAILAPSEVAGREMIATRLVRKPEDLQQVNPFAPLMLANAARTADRYVEEHPAERVGIVLRPCELRVFTELRKRSAGPVVPPEAVIIGVDCLGTYTPEEYEKTISASSADQVTAETLHNAADGGLRPQRFRTACQVCDWPAPRGADVTAGVIGVDSEKFLLIIARDEAHDSHLRLPEVAGTRPTEYQVSHRETVVGAIADMRAAVRKSMVEEMTANRRFGDVGTLLAWLSNCDLCGKCLNACPLYQGELDGLLGKRPAGEPARAPLAEMVAISHWLASCGGCGMCEETCENGVPLILLVSALSHHIRRDLDYSGGLSSAPFPWADAVSN